MVGEEEATTMLYHAVDDPTEVIPSFLDTFRYVCDMKIANDTDTRLRRLWEEAFVIPLDEPDRPVSHVHFMLDEVAPDGGHERNE